MPKHGWLTPKAIANRIKAKGLQKLRWYCQMCQKQCRDEVGRRGENFNMRTMSKQYRQIPRLVKYHLTCTGVYEISGYHSREFYIYHLVYFTSLPLSEWVQVPHHVGVPPATAAAGGRESGEVCPCLFRVSVV